MSSPVNVFTEWAPLEEMIIGSCIDFNHIAIDRHFRFIYENPDGKFGDRNQPWCIDPRYINERQEDLDNLQELLENEGVVVRRPDRPVVQEVRTPYFSSYTTACDSPRDMFLCVGDEVIETPPTNPKRFHEGYLLRRVFNDYFRKGARWTVMPRPTLDRSALDYSFWQDRLAASFELSKDIDGKFEIAMDAANCLKLGTDLLINVATANHELAAHWLERHLAGRFHVHRVRLADGHIDGHMMPVAPGRLLVNEGAMHGLYDQLPEALRKWDVIPILDTATKFDYPDDHLQMATNVGMSVNVISLDERRILIRDNATLTIKALERAGFEPIPFRLRHSELFGGGLHCTTVDVRRREVQTDYLR